MPSAAERFLLDFHARHPGATSVALGGVPVTCAGRPFASSYAVLAAHVPADASRILDVACGDGHLLALLAGTHPHAALAGVDMSAAELAAAAHRLGPRATLHRARAQALPLPDGAFDAVTCHMALMLMDDSPRVLAELRRVLRPGGTLAAVVGAGFPPSPASDLYVALIRPQLASAPGFVPLGDRRWRSPEDIGAMLAQAGFEQVGHAPIDGETRRTPAAQWDYFTLMYDTHFLQADAVAQLRQAFLAQAGAHVEQDGHLRVPARWRLVTARR